MWLQLIVSALTLLQSMSDPTMQQTDRVTVAMFARATDHRLADTVKPAQIGSYLQNERTLPADSALSLQKLLLKIKSNGTADISKCFIPRHAVSFYKEDKLTRFVLVCFECDGVRFSDSRDTRVKNDEKRVNQLNELKKYF